MISNKLWSFYSLRLAIVTIAMISCSSVGAEVVLQGEKPAYLTSPTKVFANADAVTMARYVPNLDKSFIPQGIVYLSNNILISGYFEGGSKEGCSIFTINPDSGMYQETSVSRCSHGGGLSVLNNGNIVLSDTRELIFLNPKLEEIKRVELRGTVKGSFVTARGQNIFVGTYATDFKNSYLYEFDSRKIMSAHFIDQSDALNAHSIPQRSQGGSFDADGNFWLTTNTKYNGCLIKLNHQFETIAKYKTVRGVEGISIIDSSMWLVSESGAKPYQNWPQIFPALFKINMNQLVED